MKGKIFLLTLITLIFFLFAVPSAAQTQSKEEELICESGIYEVAQTLDSESQKLLREVGFDSISATALYNLNLNSLAKALKQTILPQVKNAWHAFLSLLGVIILAALSDGLNDGVHPSKSNRIYSGICSFFIIGICAVPVANCIAASGMAMKSAGAFFAGVIPIMSIILSYQGKNLSSALFNGAALAISQVLLSTFDQFFFPFCKMILGLCAAGAIATDFHLEKIIAVLRKYLSIALSVCAGVYFTVLGLKAGISSAVDETTVKAVKLGAGNFLPVIGSALSDSAGVVVSSLSLTKNTVGVFGVAGVCAVFLPILANVLLWMMCFEAAGVAADFFSLDSIAKTLKGFGAGVSILAVMILFTALVFIINLGILLFFRGAA